MTVEIDALDRALARSGQSVTLRKLPTVDVVCPAVVRGYSPDELIADIKQQDSQVIISPTQINAATWPGVQVPGEPDTRVPRHSRGDLCIVNGVERSVQAAVGIYVRDVLVRIEMQVR